MRVLTFHFRPVKRKDNHDVLNAAVVSLGDVGGSRRNGTAHLFPSQSDIFHVVTVTTICFEEKHQGAPSSSASRGWNISPGSFS